MNADLSGWNKVYSNFQPSYFGSDTEVDAGRASWRNSPLDNMISAGIYHADGDKRWRAFISGSGPYWQSDDLMAPFQLNSTVKGIRVARRIQKQLLPTDKFLYAYQDEFYLDVIVESKTLPTHIYKEVEITQDWIGQWLTVEIDMISNKLRWYITKEMI